MGETIRICGQDRRCLECPIAELADTDEPQSRRATRIVNEVAAQHGDTIVDGSVTPDEIPHVLADEVAHAEGFSYPLDPGVMAATAAMQRVAMGDCVEYPADALALVNQPI